MRKAPESLPIINTSDYSYTLPESQIAQFPAEKRDHSRLLVYREGSISHHRFENLARFLPPGATLVFNDTRVIPARMLFPKITGAVIEIFLLNPVQPHEISRAMTEDVSCAWACIVGNKRKWRDGQTLTITIGDRDQDLKLQAQWMDREGDLIEFEWNHKLPFSEVLELVGKMPLPPYISRDLADLDAQRYQTVYSRIQGAVAAPTAGLHFTDPLLANLNGQGFSIQYVTLHVSAGTFRPIKTSNALDHPMHTESLSVERKTLTELTTDPTVIAVGTTSMRTLESVYWFGVALMSNRNAEFQIGKLDPYKVMGRTLPSGKESIQKVLQYMDERDLTALEGQSEIFIVPGYQFRICHGLITNFHLPGSSLLLLVAACIGDDWKRVYQEASDKNYRFLSYGDSSFLFPIYCG